MPNPRLANRYAKSLIDLAIEKGRLEEVHKDVAFIRQVITVSKEARMILSSPVIKAEKKIAIFSAVTDGRTGDISKGFFRLLLNKSRENILPEIVLAFEEQYNIIMGINKVKFTSPQAISEEQKKMLVEKLTAETGMTNIQLETQVDESLIGGFILQYNNKLVDASLKYELKNLQKQFNRNDYIFNIR